jgi:uncharacterized SAM-binding protein YcdF (DUF218 family)
MELFALKKLIGTLLSPLIISLFLIILGLILNFSFQKVSVVLISFGSILLFLSSIPYTADKVIKKLESQYIVFRPNGRTVDYIITLGSAHSSSQVLPASMAISSTGIKRLVEVLRLSNIYPNAKIITSGGNIDKMESQAVISKRALIELGVSSDRIITSTEAIDTAQEAKYLSLIIKHDNALLVTSANHMPRAMQFFKQYDLNITAAPAGVTVKYTIPPLNRYGFTPSSEKLYQSTAVLYESIGAFWCVVKEKIKTWV